VMVGERTSIIQNAACRDLISIVPSPKIEEPIGIGVGFKIRLRI